MGEEKTFEEIPHTIEVVWKLIDPIIIATLIISIASAIFVAMKEGVGLTLEYRESEATSRRKKEIDSKLADELRGELKNFLESDMLKKQSDKPEVFERVEELGHCAFLARSITGNMLDNMNRYIKRTFKNLAFALIILFLTVVMSISFSDVLLAPLPISGFFFGLFIFYGGTTVMFFAWAINNLKRYYVLRSRFVLLHEKSDLEYCKELEGELKKRGLW